jgi:hypothetical protein
MATKLIMLKDQVLVEVDAPSDQVQKISGGIADKVDSNLQKLRPLITKACDPILEGWQELSQKVQIERAEVELGLSFEGEGNLYITKATAGANFKIKLIIRPRV